MTPRSSDPRVSVGTRRQRLIAALRGDVHKPDRRLDRWLLLTLREEGASSTTDIIASDRFRRGPEHPRDADVMLGHEQLERWLSSALRRGLIAPQSVDVHGSPRDPAVWLLSDVGFQRLRELQRRRVRTIDRVARVLRVESAWRAAVEEITGADVAEGEPPRPRTGLAPLKRSPGDAVDAETAREQLKHVDHIVVLMMENRSFDHMLGYLGLENPEINGIQHARAITYEGTTYEPKRLKGTRFTKAVDPPHGNADVHEQIAGGRMDGFVKSFASANPAGDPGDVMGFYTWEEVPVYDYLARHYCVCDAWFSSVPGATWPNRCWSIAGHGVPGREGLFDDGLLFDLKSFARHLPEQTPESWRWYAYDPASLRLLDSRYRPGDDSGGIWPGHFRYVERHAIADIDVETDPERQREEYVLKEAPSLFEDLARGDLAAVTWIDPNFVDLTVKEPTSNDDHPPSDILAGQDLILRIYTALRSSDTWSKTLFIVTYDEHGGFYDHQRPPESPEPSPEFPTYGVRVPAFVISPLVEPGTFSHTTFDHTSLIRTILERFAPDAVGAMTDDGAARLPYADHVGRLLTRPVTDVTAAGRDGLRSLQDRLDLWRTTKAVERRLAPTPEGPQEGRVRGFPAEYLKAARQMRKDGVPAGQP